MALSTLDCTDLDSSIASLAEVLGVSSETLRQHLVTFDVNWDNPRDDGDKQVHRSLGFNSHLDLPIAAATKWFHATRAVPEADFADGLLPTMAALERLWPVLRPLALRWITAEQWDDYRESWDSSDRPFARQFVRKQMVKTWEGPFAFLVRACAVGGSDAGHKDFTKLGSEALEDICGDFEDLFGHSLREAYLKATRRCLIVFTTPWCNHDSVRSALFYAYAALHGIEPGFRGNSNFVGSGHAVPREWVQKIDWL